MEKQDKKILIIDASLKLFARYGIRKTTIDEIARSAGIAKGTIYLYFKGKEDIVAGVLTHIGDQVITTLRTVVGEAKTAPEKLHAFVLARLKFHDEQLRILEATIFSHLEFESYALSHSKLHAIVESYFEKEQKLLVSMLEKGVADGELQIEVSEIPKIAMIVCPSVESMEKSWYQLGKKMPIEEQADVFTRLIINGIGAK